MTTRLPYRIDVSLPIRINYFYCFNTVRDIKTELKTLLKCGRSAMSFWLQIYTHVNCFSQYSLNIATMISRTIFAYKIKMITTLKSVLHFGLKQTKYHNKEGKNSLYSLHSILLKNFASKIPGCILRDALLLLQRWYSKPW